MESAPRGFESPYEQFLWKELSIIRELEREGLYAKAVHHAVSLLKYLHPAVRKKHEKQGKRILTELDRAVNNATDADFYITLLNQNVVAQELGERFLDEFVTEMSDSLGKRAYMERQGASPKAKSGYGRLRVK